MLKRLYVHNYKCLVNFEINFDKDISLFLGANGSGKSTIFEVLTKLRRLIVDEEKVENVFNWSDNPRFLTNCVSSRFELDIEIENKLYKYILILEIEPFNIQIKEEFLILDDKAIIESKDGRIGNESDNILFDTYRSVIFRINRGYRLCDFMRSLKVIRINPYEIYSDIKKSNPNIKTDFSNYAEWFAYLNENNRRDISILEKSLPDILTGFDYFRIQEAGRAKILQVDFKNQSNEKQILSYDFEELSEGQKVLIALYTLIYCTPDNSLICIDEPENFVALPEIQPWFDTLYDQCAERHLQVILISHHPKIINFLASDSGYWFSRENNLTRIQKIVPENESGLSIAELVELGWIYDE